MRLPHACLVLALIALPVAGCIGQAPPGPTDPPGTEGAASEQNTSSDPAAEDRAQGNGSAGAGTQTAQANGSSGGPSNASDEPEPYDPGWPPIEEAVVRPGVKLYDKLTDQLGITDELLTDVHYYTCSTNFVFNSPGNRSLYIGTASHCVTPYDIGDTVPLADGRANGTLVYCSYGTINGATDCPDLTNGTDESHPNDFALVRIHDEDRGKVHPAALHLGGPTGLATEVAKGQEAWTYGNTDHRDARVRRAPDTLDPRAGTVASQGPWWTRIVFDPASLPGDSGSLAMTGDGQALGVVQWLGEISCPGPRPDVVGVVNLDRALAYMGTQTDLEVQLATWPVLDEPVVPSLPSVECPPGTPLGST